MACHTPVTVQGRSRFPARWVSTEAAAAGGKAPVSHCLRVSSVHFIGQEPCSCHPDCPLCRVNCCGETVTRDTSGAASFRDGQLDPGLSDKGAEKGRERSGLTTACPDFLPGSYRWLDKWRQGKHGIVEYRTGAGAACRMWRRW